MLRRLGTSIFRHGCHQTPLIEEINMTKPQDRGNEDQERTKKKPGGQQHQNPPNKTTTDNPERTPRDQKGGVEANSRHHTGNLVAPEN
jgi:hypothetical protein